MPTKIEVDLGTGEQREVEMEGDELVAYEALRAVPDPAAGPTRDERLLAAVEQATEAVQGSGAFNAAQKAVLAGVFAGLGSAISGGDA